MNAMPSHSLKSQNGFSVVELMIAMLLSTGLAVAIITVFVNNSHSFDQDDNIARMQDDAGHALRELAFEISMAGNYAELHMPDAVTPDDALSIGADCGPGGEINWMYRTVDAVTGESLSIAALDNASAAAVGTEFSCFESGELLEGTDVVLIRRVAGAEAGALAAGRVYLRTNGTVGLLFQAPFPVAPSATVAAPRADWEYRPSIYYIRRYANTAGDNIPTLCRKVLSSGPTMTTECLADGIENLQIEYGIDTSGDGNPNTYMSAPTLAELQNVVSARINLLARTTDVDVRYTNQKTFSIGNAPDYTPNDSFHRRVYSTTVAIQNIRSMNMMGF